MTRFDRPGFVPPSESNKPSSQKQDDESRESQEDVATIERAIDASLEELCERYLQKFNEGNNGIILKLKVEDVPPELVETLKVKKIDLSNDKVAKILKIYSAGKGKKEFDMQGRAHDLVAAQNDPAKYAQVPKPYFHRDFPIGKGAKQRLTNMMNKPFSGDRAEMFMMDYVPGDDLATVLYKETAKRHPKTVDSRQDLDEITFDELQDRVSQALGFAVPGGKAHDEGERDFERRKVFNQNAEVLMTYLDRQKFHLNPLIVDQIKNTMTLFHENGLAFRDGHHRNFMIVGDSSMPADGSQPERPPQVFIIDYGASELAGERKVEDLFKEVDGEEGAGAVARIYPDDFAVAEQMIRFTTSPDMRMSEEERKLKVLIDDKKKKLAGNPRVASAREASLEAAKKGEPNFDQAYRALVGAGLPTDNAIDAFLTVISSTVEARPEAAEAAASYLDSLIERKPTASILNKLRRFKNTL